MDTKELAARLAAMEALSDPQDQECAFNALQAALQRDTLEIVVDEDRQFAVRLKQTEESV